MNLPGQIVAAALRDEAQEIAEGRGPWGGVTHTCRECERPSLSLEDGRCGLCLGADSYAADEARRREGLRRLHRDTAMLLRREGFAERAAWHEQEAER